MREFKIISIIRKWWIVIVLISLLGAIGFNYYLNSKQTYTARTMISYISEGAESGLTPALTKIDVSEISSSNVVKSALEALGMTSGLERIRSQIYVEPIISEDEETRKAAILDDGEEYSYFPTEYIVSFVADSDEGDYYASRVLDAVLDSYFNYYCQKYVNVDIYPNSCENALNDEFDYIESVEIVDTSLHNMLVYLYARTEVYPGYRSSTTGYSYNGLLKLYQNLYDINVYPLYADVLDNALTKDADLLEHKYSARILNNKLSISSNEEHSDAVKRTIASYVEKSAESQQRYGYGNSSNNATGTNDNSVIEFVERYQGVSKDTTYDNMVYEYVGYETEMRTAQIDNDFNALVLQKFSENAAKNTGDAQAEFSERLNSVVNTSKELYALLKGTVDEFNDYLAVKNVASQSSIQVVTGINIKMYLLIVFALFIMVGTVGAILLGYFSKVFTNMLYVDSKTGLPNKLSCDRMIDTYSHKPLPPDTSLCAINLDNLLETNEREGREYGDMMLKNIGIIIHSFAESYGVIGYNGGSMFFGVFEHCDANKAQLFVDNFLDAVGRYNKQFPNNAMKVRCIVNEARDTGIYEVRALLKRTISDVRDRIRRDA